MSPKLKQKVGKYQTFRIVLKYLLDYEKYIDKR
jgi:hypothetical protein